MGNITNGTGAVVRANINNTLVSYSDSFCFDLQYYYQRNIKLIASGSVLEEEWAGTSWEGVSGTVGVDTVDYRTGWQSIIISSANSGGGCRLIKTMDLSTFNDGGDSGSGDYICFPLYINTSDIDKLAAGLKVRILCDTAPTVTNLFSLTIVKASLVNGWNYFHIAKSAFIATGNPLWSNVKGMDFIFDGALSSSAIFKVDNIMMVRTDPAAGKPNPFQRLVNGVWTRDFVINNGEWFVGREGGVITCRNLNPAAGPAVLLTSQAFTNDLSIIQSITCKTGGYAHGVSWYQDENNYVKAYIHNNVLYLTKVESAVSTEIGTAFTVAANDRIILRLTKSGISITLVAIKNADLNNPVELNTGINFNTNGYLGIVCDTDRYVNLLSVGISKIICTMKSLETEALRETRLYYPGMIGYFAQPVPPAGWLTADGSSKKRIDYPDLYAAIRNYYNKTFTVDTSTDIVTCTAHGFYTGDPVDVYIETRSGIGNVLPGGLTTSTIYYFRQIDANTGTLHPTADDANNDTNKIDITSTGTGIFQIASINTFMLPDGSDFIRGWMPGDSRVLGSYQTDAFQGHGHNLYTGKNDTTQYHAPGPLGGGDIAHIGYTGTFLYNDKVKGAISDGHGNVDSSSNETRPKNRAFLVCIKY